MSTTRFSKATLVSYLQTQVAALELRYNFDSNNGTAQLRQELCQDLGDIDVIVAYGKYRALQDLIDRVNYGIV